MNYQVLKIARRSPHLCAFIEGVDLTQSLSATAVAEIKAALLECATFQTFAAAIQQRVGLPIVEYISFMDFILRTLVCRRYTGFL